MVKAGGRLLLILPRSAGKIQSNQLSLQEMLTHAKNGPDTWADDTDKVNVY